MVAFYYVKKYAFYAFAITFSQATIFIMAANAATPLSLPQEKYTSSFSNIQQPVKPPVDRQKITNNPTQILARVDNIVITVKDVENLASNLPNTLKSLPKELLYPQLTKQLIVDLALQIAIRKDGIAQQPAIQRQINAAITELTQKKLAQAYLFEKLKPHLTPKAIQHYYNEHYLHQSPIKEVNLRAIIVQSPEVADIVLQKLNNGQSFLNATHIYSIDLQNRDQNKGDMGWLKINELDQSIIQAISQLKNNEYTKKAVRTSYGWVILQKIAERNQPVPSLESAEPLIKDQITKEIVNQVYEESLKNVHIIEY